MPRRFDLLVFDWDGTLMDSAAAIADSLQAACRDLGHAVPSDSAARFVIGLGLADAMRHILPDLDPAAYPPLVERYRHHFLLRDAQTRLFPGAAEAVRELHGRGFLLGIATGKSRRGLDRALDACGLRPYFHASRCADEGPAKPHPGMLRHLMASLGVDEERALMIGDTTHDLAMARAARVRGLAAAYGAHPRQQLLAYEPLACFDSFTGVRAWLAQHA